MFRTRFMSGVLIVALRMGTPAATIADETPATQPTASTQPAITQPVETQPSSQPALQRSHDHLADFEQAIIQLVDAASPSVVAIAVDRKPSPAAARFDPFAATANGSGVIIRTDGMILTSQHVIADAATINVTLHDGRRLRARRVAADPRADLAVIRVGADDLSAASLGDARQLRRGAWVLALGNPLGLSADGQAAVSLGIVSAIARPLPETFGRDEDRYYGDMIQASAPIHPGHSGGPLVDIRGRVVGIVAAASLPATGGESIAFAVPITPRTLAVIDKLLSGEDPDYGYAGVRVGSLSEVRGRRDRGGVLLETVFPDGPAHAAGLRAGDAVLAIDGVTVESADDFIQRVGEAGPDKSVDVEFDRGGRRDRASLKLSRRPIAAGADRPISPFEFRGATFGELDVDVRAASHAPERALIVLVVAAGSSADRAGLTPGDVIVRIEGRAIPTDVDRQLPSATGDVLLGLANGGSVLVRNK